MNNYFSNKRRLFLLSGATAVLAPLVTQASNQNFGILDKTAPELEISKWIDADGKATTFKLADHKGKYIFMEFWQSWCPGCHKLGFPGLKKISDHFKDNKHFTAVAIQTTFEGYHTNTADKMRDIQKRYKLNIVMGHDPGNKTLDTHPKTMRDYRSGGTPWAVLISPEGKVIYNDFHISPDSAINYLEKQLKKMG